MIGNLTDMLASSNPIEHLVARPVELFGWSRPWLTNHVVMLSVAALLMLIVFPLAARQRTMIPSGLRNLVETVCAFLRDEVARPVLGKDTDKFMPYLWTIFFLILFCNLLGMVPLDGILYLLTWGKVKHLGGTATGNIWVTGAMASTAFLMIQISGVREQGLKDYVKNFIPPVPLPLWPLMYLLEVIAALVKPFALAIRLFANMLAGHAVLGAFLGLIFLAHSWSVGGLMVVVCAVFSLLELFVAFLQAYIFTFLTAIFLSAAIHPEH